MKIILTWQTLSALLNEMKSIFEKELPKEILKKIKNTTPYYFLSGQERKENPTQPSLGLSIIKKSKQSNKNIGEKSVYNYLYIPSTKNRSQEFKKNGAYPDAFFHYIDCKGASDFLKKAEKEALMTERDIRIQRQLLVNYKPSEENYTYVLFYIPDNNKIKKGILSISGLKKASLKFYGNESKTSYTGTVSLDKNILYISLSRSNGQGKVSLILYIGNEGLNEKLNFIQGTFTGVGTDSSLLAGKLILEKTLEKDVFDAPSLEKFQLKNEVAISLLGQNIKIPNKTISNLEDVLNFNSETINRIQGIYASYLIDNNDYCFSRSIFTINKDFTVECKSPSATYFGHVEFLVSGSIAILHLKSRQNGFKFQTVLETAFQKSPYQENKEKNEEREDEGQYLCGIYAGINTKNTPRSGKELFIKYLNKKDVESPGLLKLSNKAFKKVARKHRFIEYFFANKSIKKYTESVHVIRKIKSLEASRPWINKFVGTYDLYYRSTVPFSLKKYLLQINSDGSVNLRGKDDYLGSFHVHNFNLIINIHTLDYHEEYLRQITIFLGQDLNEKIDNAIGLFTGLSDAGSPASVRCVLKRESTPFENRHIEDIELDIEDIEIMEKSDLKKYLFGETNNVLITPRKINIKEYPNSNFGEVFFNSACHLANSYSKTSESKNIPKVITQLEQSINNGFLNKGILKKEFKNGGCFFPLKEQIETYFRIKYPEGGHIMLDCINNNTKLEQDKHWK